MKRMIWRKIRSFFEDEEVKIMQHMLKELKEITPVGWTGFQNIAEAAKEWPIGISKNLQGNDTMLLEKKPGYFLFFTMIPPGHYFPIHWHNMSERCIVVRGSLYDDVVLLEAPIRAGQEITYKPLQKHRPCNASETESCLMLVEFF